MGHTPVMGRAFLKNRSAAGTNRCLPRFVWGVLIYLGLRNRHLQEQLPCKRGW